MYVCKNPCVHGRLGDPSKIAKMDEATKEETCRGIIYVLLKGA